MEQEELQKLLDSLAKGPLGTKTDAQWTQYNVLRQNSINNAKNKEIRRRVTESTDWKAKSRLQKGSTKYTKQMLTPEARKKAIAKTKKKVAAYNKDGSLFKVFLSPTDAANELGIHRGLIYDTLGGIQKSCHKMTWKYVKD